MSVYNGAEHVASAIDSILAQLGVQFEFIIVNDGSTDATREVLVRYASDPRIRILEQTRTGLTGALIAGCAAARGEYVARQDADDVSLPGRLRLQAALLRSDAGVAFVSCESEVVGPGGEILFLQSRRLDSNVATRELFDRISSPPGHGSVMFRRSCYEAVGGYRPEFLRAQDADLWLRLGTAGRLAYVPQPLYRYRVATNGISGEDDPIRRYFIDLVDRCFEARSRGGDDREILAAACAPQPVEDGDRRRRVYGTYYFIGRCLMRRGDPRAIPYLLDCVRANPFFARGWLMLAVALVARPWQQTPIREVPS